MDSPRPGRLGKKAAIWLLFVTLFIIPTNVHQAFIYFMGRDLLQKEMVTTDKRFKEALVILFTTKPALGKFIFSSGRGRNIGPLVCFYISEGEKEVFDLGIH